MDNIRYILGTSKKKPSIKKGGNLKKEDLWVVTDIKDGLVFYYNEEMDFDGSRDIDEFIEMVNDNVWVFLDDNDHYIINYDK